jgi:predicted nuclease of predicted toxin-antitoxin system
VPQVRVYTDEDIVAELAIQLRRHGYDVISCREAGNHNRRLDDEQQLEYATSQGRAILTRNAVDFIRLDMQWKSAGREHSGIICLSRNPTIAEMVMRTRAHLDQVSSEQHHNTLYWA